MLWMAPNGAGQFFFPANPDLVDILGEMHLDFENLEFFSFWTPSFWISRSPDLQIPRFLDFQVQDDILGDYPYFPRGLAESNVNLGLADIG